LNELGTILTLRNDQLQRFALALVVEIPFQLLSYALHADANDRINFRVKRVMTLEDCGGNLIFLEAVLSSDGLLADVAQNFSQGNGMREMWACQDSVQQILLRGKHLNGPGVARLVQTRSYHSKLLPTLAVGKRSARRTPLKIRPRLFARTKSQPSHKSARTDSPKWKPGSR